MISQVVTAFVDGYALLDRASDRRRMIDACRARVEAHAREGRDRIFVVVKSPDDMRRGLRAIADDSATVFVDCALERCDDEADLLACYDELCRVTGARRDRCEDLFVLHVQRWASARVSLDPRVRWVITSAPPRRDGGAKLEYRPFGRRRTVLADVKRGRK